MLGFSLSKLNLLILVVALFAIISYFYMGMQDIIIRDKASQIADKYYGEIVNRASEGSLCNSQSGIIFPRTISIVGGGRFYAVQISKFEPADPDKLNSIIVKVVDRKDRSNVLAAKSLDVNAEIRLFAWDPKTSTVTEETMISIDPQNAPRPVDAMNVVKETYQGKGIVYVVACSSVAGICELNSGTVGCTVKGERAGNASSCIAPSTPC